MVPSYVSTASPNTAEICRPGDVIAPHLLAPGFSTGAWRNYR
ncbi:hypothetical protein [Saccharopolyspora rectivirgula]|nr:hypothetical protein [Saccharopolyspora rectivirgula]